jgi:eukaryotic-like serine/threonine-protein kinase
MRSIGRYAVRGLLGRGGMSVVYKVSPPWSPRIQALKVLRPRDEMLRELVGGEELRRRFLKEAEIMGAVRHPHLAPVLDVGEHDGCPFFTMAYYAHSLGSVMGESYRVEEPSRVLGVERSARYAGQVLLGLGRLHYAGLIHRDIKPFNVLLTEEDTVQIIDFGLSRSRGETGPSVRGLGVGSPYYAAPEQEHDPEGVDGRADLFAVGVLLYRMLTGRIPDPAVRRPEPASRINPDLGRGWDLFLEKAMHPKPSGRFGSAEEMHAALRELHSRWRIEGEGACSVLPPERPTFADEVGGESVRSEPLKVPLKTAREQFGLDRLWRASAYHRHALEPVGDDLVRDRTTGLAWQRRGSGFSLDWGEAREYVRWLVEVRCSGLAGWRLPTVPELMTLLRPPATREDLCVDPCFDPGLRWVWSADTSTSTGAWIADLELGYIGRQDMAGLAKVCAVSSAGI